MNHPLTGRSNPGTDEDVITVLRRAFRQSLVLLFNRDPLRGQTHRKRFTRLGSIPWIPVFVRGCGCVLRQAFPVRLRDMLELDLFLAIRLGNTKIENLEIR